MRVERIGEAGDDLVLHVEKVGDGLVESLGPKMIARFGVDQLNVDPHPLAAALHASLEHIARIQLTADLLEIARLALVGEGRVAPDHQHAGHARKVRRQALGHAVYEIFLFWIAADVREGQNNDGETRRPRFLLMRRMRRTRRAGPIGLDRMNPHRPRDVLETVIAEIDELFLQLVPDLTIDVFGKANAAGFRDPFEARGDIDTVAHQVAVRFLDHVTEMNPDAELDAAIPRHAGVALDHRALQFGRETHRVDGAAKLDDRTVAGALDDPAVVDRDGGIDQIAAQRSQPREDAILVRSGQTAVAGDVGNHNRCYFPGFAHGAPLSRRHTST